MVDSSAVSHINGRAMDVKQGRVAAAVSESQSNTRWLSYDELSEITAMSRDKIVRLARRNKWAKREGNVPGEMRFAVPTSMIVDLQTKRGDVQDLKEGQPGSPTVLGAIYQKFMHLEDREDRLEGYLREQMEREYARADAAEAALTKAERRLEKYTQALEATQVAVAARAAAEAALVSATHRLELMQAAAEISRAEAAKAEQAGVTQIEAYRAQASVAADQVQALLYERQQAQIAMADAATQHERLVAEATAERAALETLAAEERIRCEAYFGQVQAAAVVTHTLEARCLAVENALLGAIDDLNRAQLAAQAERAHIELVLTDRIGIAEAALAEAQQQAATAVEERSGFEAALSVSNQSLATLQQEAEAKEARCLAAENALSVATDDLGRAQSTALAERAHIELVFTDRIGIVEAALAEAHEQRNQLVAALSSANQSLSTLQQEAEANREATEAAVGALSAEASTLRGMARQAAEARSDVEAAMAALDSRFIAAQNTAEAERAHMTAEYSTRLADLEHRLQQAYADTNQLEAERSADVALLQAQAKSAGETADAATLAQTQTIAALAALAQQVAAAEAAAAHERTEISALLEEARGKSDKATAALAEADLRGDRAVGQLEAERARTKQVMERLSEAEAKILVGDRLRSAGLLTRLLAAVTAK